MKLLSTILSVIAVLSCSAWAYLIARVFMCLHHNDLDGSFYWEVRSFWPLLVLFLTLMFGLAVTLMEENKCRSKAR